MTPVASSPPGAAASRLRGQRLGHWRADQLELLGLGQMLVRRAVAVVVQRHRAGTACRGASWRGTAAGWPLDVESVLRHALEDVERAAPRSPARRARRAAGRAWGSGAGCRGTACAPGARSSGGRRPAARRWPRRSEAPARARLVPPSMSRRQLSVDRPADLVHELRPCPPVWPSPVLLDQPRVWPGRVKVKTQPVLSSR